MGIRLLVKQRSEAGGAEKSAEVVLADGPITLGRDKSCQVVLAEHAVSRNHARIVQEGALFFVEDLGSSYGTQVNGKKLPRGEKRLLKNGDVIAIAQFDVTFERIPEMPSNEKTTRVARKIIKDVLKGLEGAGPYFRVMNGSHEGHRIEVSEAKELLVGRDSKCDLVLHDHLVSRRHAKIRRDWAGTHVEDLKSRNGLKVNDARVRRKTLKDKDELLIGSTRLLYVDPSEVKEPTGDVPGADLPPPPPPPPSPEPEPPPADVEGPPTGEESSPDHPEAPEEGEPEGSAPDGPSEESDDSAEPPTVSAPPKLNRRVKRLVIIAALGVFGLLALALIIAVLVGA